MKFSKIATLLGAVSAWWDNGHLLTARIAYDVLLEESPETVEAVKEILAPLRDSDPDYTSNESVERGFVECATWADEIKHKGGMWQASWHFVNTPFFSDGGSIEDYPDFKFDENNVTAIVPNIVSWFKNEPGYEEGFAYQTIMNHTYQVHTEVTGKSMAMRLLIHYIGDLHQPLHCSTRINDEFPKGDKGGNDFKLPSVDQKELHAVWDSVVLEFADSTANSYQYSSLPFSDDDWNMYGDIAQRYRDSWTTTVEERAKDLDVNHWANEDFNMVTQFIYNGIEQNKELPQDYISKGRDLAQQQVILGGLRLAKILKSLNLTSQKIEDHYGHGLFQ